MSKHSQPSGRHGDNQKRRAAPRREQSGTHTALVIGWAFLGLMILLAVAAIIALLPRREKPAAPAAPQATTAPGPGGSAFVNPETTAPPLSTQDGQGGRSVVISDILCDYAEPEEVVVGTLQSVDLTALAESVIQNVRSAGWGEVEYTVTENGSLLLHAASLPQLSAADYEKQTDFLASSQPENLARTFLDNSGLIGLLRQYGLNLSSAAENNGGEITFRGTGDAPQAECSVRFTFLFTGAFNQAVVRAVYLSDAVTVRDIVPLKRAVAHAVTWDAGEEAVTAVTGVELRHVRGIPFYVLTCSDGTVAYALAVTEDALGQVPGAEAVYRELLSGGIQDNIAIPGAA